MQTMKFIRATIVLIGILLSACDPAANSAAPAAGGGKGLADVMFSGVIESMNGDQWVVNGQTIKVDSSVLRDGPFAVGDTVKVDASRSDDGTVIARRVETPSAVATEAATSAPDDSSSSSDNSATPQAPAFDHQGNEAVGSVDAMTDTSITVGGRTYPFAPGAEIKGDIVTGSAVKLHFTVNADGSLLVTEIELSTATQVSDTKSNDDSSTHDINDDHGGTTTASDDGTNHDTNDDHGGNSNSGGGGSDDSSSSDSGHGG